MKSLLFLLLFTQLFSSTLQLATSANPSRLNPILATDSSSSEIAGFIFNGLVKYDKDSKEIIGDLAKKFYFKNDTTLIFVLRENVKWQDGKKFTANDVLFTYKTLISKQIVSPYSSGFRFVKQVRVLDNYTVEVDYKKPYFKALETWMMGILPEHILKNEPNMMNSSFNTHPVGTGPYRLTQLEFSKNIELSANADYFQGKPKIDKISFHVIPDPMTRLLMLKNRQLDIGGIEPLVMQRQLKKKLFH
jgi:peptide/nickel transport system substrate-binding protein